MNLKDKLQGLRKQNGYSYYDTYLGRERFAGEEAVWLHENPVWSMNYTGRIMDENFNTVTKSNLSASDYVINLYVGCPHACKYCYASFIKRFTGHNEKWA